jgi:hypothetical protein
VGKDIVVQLLPSLLIKPDVALTITKSSLSSDQVIPLPPLFKTDVQEIPSELDTVSVGDVTTNKPSEDDQAPSS